jgi:hypothetical protein
MVISLAGIIEQNELGNYSISYLHDIETEDFVGNALNWSYTVLPIDTEPQFGTTIIDNTENEKVIFLSFQGLLVVNDFVLSNQAEVTFLASVIIINGSSFQNVTKLNFIADNRNNFDISTGQINATQSLNGLVFSLGDIQSNIFLELGANKIYIQSSLEVLSLNATAESLISALPGLVNISSFVQLNAKQVSINGDMTAGDFSVTSEKFINKGMLTVKNDLLLNSLKSFSNLGTIRANNLLFTEAPCFFDTSAGIAVINGTTEFSGSPEETVNYKLSFFRNLQTKTLILNVTKFDFDFDKASFNLILTTNSNNINSNIYLYSNLQVEGNFHINAPGLDIRGDLTVNGNLTGIMRDHLLFVGSWLPDDKDLIQREWEGYCSLFEHGIIYHTFKMSEGSRPVGPAQTKVAGNVRVDGSIYFELTGIDSKLIFDKAISISASHNITFKAPLAKSLILIHEKLTGQKEDTHKYGWDYVGSFEFERVKFSAGEYLYINVMKFIASHPAILHVGNGAIVQTQEKVDFGKGIQSSYGFMRRPCEPIWVDRSIDSEIIIAKPGVGLMLVSNNDVTLNIGRVFFVAGDVLVRSYNGKASIYGQVLALQASTLPALPDPSMNYLQNLPIEQLIEMQRMIYFGSYIPNNAASPVYALQIASGDNLNALNLFNVQIQSGGLQASYGQLGYVPYAGSIKVIADNGNVEIGALTLFTPGTIELRGNNVKLYSVMSNYLKECGVDYVHYGTKVAPTLLGANQVIIEAINGNVVSEGAVLVAENIQVKSTENVYAHAISETVVNHQWHIDSGLFSDTLTIQSWSSTTVMPTIFVARDQALIESNAIKILGSNVVGLKATLLETSDLIVEPFTFRQFYHVEVESSGITLGPVLDSVFGSKAHINPIAFGNSVFNIAQFVDSVKQLGKVDERLKTMQLTNIAIEGFKVLEAFAKAYNGKDNRNIGQFILGELGVRESDTFGFVPSNIGIFQQKEAFGNEEILALKSCVGCGIGDEVYVIVSGHAKIDGSDIAGRKLTFFKADSASVSSFKARHRDYHTFERTVLTTDGQSIGISQSFANQQGAGYKLYDSHLGAQDGLLKIEIGQDFYFEGRAIGEYLVADIGGKLSIVTPKEQYKSFSDQSSYSIQIGFDAAIKGFSFSNGEGSTEVENAHVSVFGATNQAQINVSGELSLDGAVVVGEKGSTLSAGSISASSVASNTRSDSSGFAISADFTNMGDNPSSAVIGGVSIYDTDNDKEAVHRATVAEGFTVTASSVNGELNRDMSKATEVTRDESEGYGFTIPLVNFNALGESFGDIGEMIGAGGGSTDPANMPRSVNEDVQSDEQNEQYGKNIDADGHKVYDQEIGPKVQSNIAFNDEVDPEFSLSNAKRDLTKIANNFYEEYIGPIEKIEGRSGNKVLNTADNDVDAVRHALSYALIVRKFKAMPIINSVSGSAANFVGRAGESIDNPNELIAAKTNMDLYNNQVGIQIGLKARNYGEVKKMVYDAYFGDQLILKVDDTRAKPIYSTIFTYHYTGFSNAITVDISRYQWQGKCLIQNCEEKK